MVKLGVGKNMVRSIRFWSQVMGMAEAETKRSSLSVTDFGRILLAEKGVDPFLEDIRTLWLLHWNLATNIENPLLAWDFLLNRWQEPELVPSAALKALQKEAEKQESQFSPVTWNNTSKRFYTPTIQPEAGKEEFRKTIWIVHSSNLNSSWGAEQSHTIQALRQRLRR